MEIIGHVGDELRGLITFDNGAAAAWFDDETFIASPVSGSLTPAVRHFEELEEDPFFEAIMNPCPGPTRRMNKVERALFELIVTMADAD